MKKKKPNPKKNSGTKDSYTGEDLKRHVGAIMEEVRDGFKAQNEQTMGVIERLDRMEKTLDSHSNQIANLTMDTMEVKSDVRQIKLDIKLNLDRKVDKKHFVDLEGRVRELEK